MIERLKEHETLRRLIARHPVVGIIGARQVGKTTLARSFVRTTHEPYSFFDLENSEDLARLSDPLFTLKKLKGLIVIDEVQRLPGIFSALRVLVDRPRPSARFLVLGSASPKLLRQSSETLAGRIFYHEVTGFGVDEVGIGNHERLWVRGGFPRSYLDRTADGSLEWRQEFITTFLERDLPQLGIAFPAITMRRFWNMLAHCHGQIWNSSEFGRAFGVADTTVRRYLDALVAAMVIRTLQPWHENITKRQVKSPKIYLSDSGLLHALLNMTTLHDLEGHPKIGASWEGFVINQIIRHLRIRAEECYFWATHAGSELDLLVIRGNRRLGFEIKRSSSPQPTPSIRHAMADLKLNRLNIIHAGDETFEMTKGVRAVAFCRLLEDLGPIR